MLLPLMSFFIGCLPDSESRPCHVGLPRLDRTSAPVPKHRRVDAKLRPNVDTHFFGARTGTLVAGHNVD